MPVTVNDEKKLDSCTFHDVGWIYNKITKFEARDDDDDWSCQEILKAK